MCSIPLIADIAVSIQSLHEHDQEALQPLQNEFIMFCRLLLLNFVALTGYSGRALATRTARYALPHAASVQGCTLCTRACVACVCRKAT